MTDKWTDWTEAPDHRPPQLPGTYSGMQRLLLHWNSVAPQGWQFSSSSSEPSRQSSLPSQNSQSGMQR